MFRGMLGRSVRIPPHGALPCGFGSRRPALGSGKPVFASLRFASLRSRPPCRPPRLPMLPLFSRLRSI
eukprot:2814476-Pyramimonas_sp.AAC.1